MIQKITKINAGKVRSKCIAMGWYTMGTVAEYSNMLEKCIDKNNGYGDIECDMHLLEIIAMDIVAHSDDCWQGYDGSPKLNVMFELDSDCCYSYFEEV